MKVWLDDERKAPAGWKHVHWPDEAIKLLQTGRVDEISLDHDLGDDRRGTGNDVVTWIEEAVVTQGFEPPEINVHTANPAAARKMEMGVKQIYKLHDRFKRRVASRVRWEKRRDYRGRSVWEAEETAPDVATIQGKVIEMGPREYSWNVEYEAVWDSESMGSGEESSLRQAQREAEKIMGVRTATGFNQPGVNPYLNTPPTELARDVKKEKCPKKRKQMEKALEAWRGTFGNPMAPGTTGGGGLPGGQAMHDKDADFLKLSPEDDVDTAFGHLIGALRDAGFVGENNDPEKMDDDTINEAIKEESKTYPDKPDYAEEVAVWTLEDDDEYYKRLKDVEEKGYHMYMHVGADKTGGILDEVKDRRMDWLWGYNKSKDQLFIRRPAMLEIENLFYRHMGKMGFPKPAADWVLTMAIVGGAASLQWTDDSDVDVSVIVDWKKLFDKMRKWKKHRWERIGLPKEYDRVQQGKRIHGKLVAKAMMNALWGFGHFRGKGIIDDPALNRLAPGHPINFRIMRRLHKDDLRFDDQPMVIEGDSISAYIIEIPVKRRRQLENLGARDINWIAKARDLPRGFNLKRDVPAVYDEALGQLRYATMPFDFLWAPRKPKDVGRALKVLGTRYHRIHNDLRTRGYLDYRKDPNAHSFDVGGETYALPDAFPANIAVKLMEKSGASDAIKKLLFEMRSLKNDRYVSSNFGAVKSEIQDILREPYGKVRKLLKDYSKPVKYETRYP